MFKKICIVSLALATFTAHSMERQFDIQEIASLAQKNNYHQPFIETYFALQLPQEKPARDLRFIEIQSRIHNQTRACAYSEGAKQCLLNHLMLAYYKKELDYHSQELAMCKQKIKTLDDALKNKK